MPAGPDVPLYLDEGLLIARSGIDDLAQLASVPPGALGTALVDQDTLLLVRERGIERVSLTDGAAEPVVELDEQAMYGSFRPTRDGQLIYAVVIDDPSLPFGVGTRIGLYDPASGAATPILSEPAMLELLGTSADGAAMIVLPRGQDPSFGLFQLRALSDGQVLEELQVPGEGFAAVSPDGRWAAVSSRRVVDGQGAVADELLLYDLTARPLVAQPVALPQGGAASGGVWAPDGGRFYFGYGPGNIYMLEGSHGLWGLNPETLEAARVADVDVQNTRIDGISPGGTVLLRGLMSGDSFLVDAQSGVVTSTVIPPSAFVVGWQ
jgi:hypothetical protein